MKDIESIVLVCKDNLNDDSLIEKIKAICSPRKLFVVPYSETDSSVLESSDLVITLGGDGTFIRAANLITRPLILGINSNPSFSEGALTQIDATSDLSKLKLVLEGHYEIIKRTRIATSINGRTLPEMATNEVYIGTELQFHTSRYCIEFEGFSEEHRSSGIIISTGTGSTSWFSSVGGKKFGISDKLLKFVVREPYIGSKVFLPKLLSGDISENKELIIKCTRESGSIIAINDVAYKFNSGDVAKISISSSPLNCVVPKT
jgi:NAD kinase